MRRRHPPVPRLWLMTDERMGEGLWDALERVPRGSGVVFRHYSLASSERRALFRQVEDLARRRGLMLVRAGASVGRHAGGVHAQRGAGLRTYPAHDRKQALAAVHAGADLLFVSPVFATRSHPGAKALGRARLGMLIRGLKVPVIALGGMDARRAASLRPLGIHGWAAIDAWTRS